MKAGTRVFLGHSVKDSPLLIDPKHTPNSMNVRIDNPLGALNNQVGIQKYTNAGSPEAVVAIHQLEDTLFFRGGDKLWRGLWADFLAFPECGYPPETGRVQFVDITADPYGDITAFLWDFGDGDTSTDQHPMHTYAEAGVYTVSLKVFVGDLWFQKVEEQYIKFDDERIYCNAFLDIPNTGAHWCYNSDTGEWEYTESGNVPQCCIADDIMPQIMRRLLVPSNSNSGYVYTHEESAGAYRLQIRSPEDFAPEDYYPNRVYCAWTFPPWQSDMHWVGGNIAVFKNKTPTWEGEEGGGSLTGYDYKFPYCSGTLGDQVDGKKEAADKARDLYYDISLDTGDYLILMVVDNRDWYGDNLGNITLRISRL